MKYYKKPVSTHCHEVIPMGDMTALDFDADIPTAVGAEKRQECCQLLVRKISVEITV